MIKILIADDEETERKILKRQLENSLQGICVYADVKNGLELLEKAPKIDPDIMVVDISMPGLSGLEAIHRLREKGLSSKIIICSAYGEFDYAKSAIASRVDEYLLKPVRKEQFVQLIRTCMQQIKAEGIQKKRNRERDLLVAQMEVSIKADFLQDLAYGVIDENRSKLYCRAIGLPSQRGMILVFEGDSETDFSLVAREVSDDIRMHWHGTTGTLPSGRMACFIPVGPKICKVEAAEFGKEVAESILKKLSENQLDCIAGIGRVQNEFSQMGISFEEALRALHNPKTNLKVRSYEELTKGRDNPLVACCKCVMEAIKRKRFDEACQIVKPQIRTVEEIETAYDFLYQLLVLIIRELQVSGLQQKRLAPKSVLPAGHSIQTREELHTWFYESCTAIYDLLVEKRYGTCGKVVTQALQYMTDHLEQDISLDYVAEQIGISPYYLSRQFKAEIGENFISFLNQMRIRKAKQLAMEHNFSIRELSQMVGYQNPTYFCKVFKKLTGMTINEFRKS